MTASSTTSTSTSSTTTTLAGNLDCESALEHGLVTLSDGVLRCQARAAARTARGRAFDEAGCLAPYRAAYDCLVSHRPKDRFGKVRCSDPDLQDADCPACLAGLRTALPDMITEGLHPLVADTFCGLDAPARRVQRAAVRCGRLLNRRFAAMAVAVARCRLDEATGGLAGVASSAPACEQKARDAFKTPRACAHTCQGLKVGAAADDFFTTLTAAVQQPFCACPRDGADVLCGDDNPCTHDYCDGTQCLHNPISGSCSTGDDNPCATGACANGTCVSQPLGDGTPCTDKCSECVAGTCTSFQNSTFRCLDDNPCTSDACDPALGCVHAPLPDGTPCSADSNPCTLDFCQSGTCIARPISGCTQRAP